MAVIKPQTPIVNWSHPLTRGLIYILPLFEGGGKSSIDLTGIYGSATFQGTPAWTPQGVKFPTVNDYLNLGTALPQVISNAVSIVLQWKKLDTTNRASGAVYTDYGSDDTLRLGFNLPWSDGTVYWDFGGTDATHRVSKAGLTFANDIWAFTVGGGNQSIYQNGVQVATAANSPSRNTASTTLQINRITGASVGDVAECKFLYIYNRSITSQEARDLYADPFQIFTRPIYSYDSSPGTTTSTSTSTSSTSSSSSTSSTSSSSSSTSSTSSSTSSTSSSTSSTSSSSSTSSTSSSSSTSSTSSSTSSTSSSSSTSSTSSSTSSTSTSSTSSSSSTSTSQTASTSTSSTSSSSSTSSTSSSSSSSSSTSTSSSSSSISSSTSSTSSSSSISTSTSSSTSSTSSSTSSSSSSSTSTLMFKPLIDILKEF